LFHKYLLRSPLRELGSRAVLLFCLLLCGCGGSGLQEYVFTGTAGYPQPSRQISGTVFYQSLLPLSELRPDQSAVAPAVLDFANPVSRPCRFVRVQLLDRNGEILEESHTGGQGTFSFSIPHQPGEMKIRVWAETVELEGESAPIKVVDNTRGGAPYAADSDWLDEQATEVTINFPTGYTLDGVQPEGAIRSSGPFACLDGILTGYRFFLEGGLDPAGMPVCVVNWSEKNRPSSGEKSDGAIDTSHFSSEENQLFILGFAAADTDEFDWHVMIHEFGHWIQFNRFRDNNIGGTHGFGEIKEPRLAFSEGFGNALGGLALQDPIYKDTSTPTGSSHTMECNLSVVDPNPGWFSEATVEAILFDLFDPVRAEGGDSNFADDLALSPSIFIAALEAQRESSALTTIFSFLHGMVQIEITPGELASLQALLAFSSPNSDFGLNSLNAFGEGETHDAGLPGVLPLYLDVTTDIDAGPFSVTLGPAEDETYNWLESGRFLRFTGDSSTVTVRALNSGSTVGSIGIILYQAGVQVEDDGDATEDENQDPFEDDIATIATRPGVIYVVSLLNLADQPSTTDIVITR